MIILFKIWREKKKKNDNEFLKFCPLIFHRLCVILLEFQKK